MRGDQSFQGLLEVQLDPLTRNSLSLPSSGNASGICGCTAIRFYYVQTSIYISAEIG